MIVQDRRTAVAFKTPKKGRVIFVARAAALCGRNAPGRVRVLVWDIVDSRTRAGGQMIYQLGWTAVAVALFAIAGCTTPDMSPELTQCEGGPGISGDAKLSGCTAVIESGGETDEKLAEAFRNRCSVYEEKGERDAAIRDCDRAIELNPDDLDARRWRAVAYLNKGDYDRAIADYDQASG